MQNPHAHDAAQSNGIPLPMLLTVNQVAKALNVSPRTVWRHLSTGQMPEPIRIGGSVRWRICDIRLWIEAGAKASQPQPRRKA